MADNKVRAEYPTGHTLTFSVYNGTTDALRGSAGQAMTEAATTYYVGTPSPAMVSLDWIIVLADGVPVYQGQYQPEVTNPSLEAKVDIIDTNVDTVTTGVASLITARGVIQNNSVQQEADISTTKARIYI